METRLVINQVNLMLHVLRNPHEHGDDVVRQARLWAADEIERLRREVGGRR